MEKVFAKNLDPILNFQVSKKLSENLKLKTSAALGKQDQKFEKFPKKKRILKL